MARMNEDTPLPELSLAGIASQRKVKEKGEAKL
jgi:hypothetical protein